MSISLNYLDMPKWRPTKPCHRFAYQWLDTVRVLINKYAKFDPNIPYDSRIMNIFPIWPRHAGLMLSKASSIKKRIDPHSDSRVVQDCSTWSLTLFYTCQWLEIVDMRFVCKIWSIQVYTMWFKSLWTFSLTGHGRTDSHSDYSADPRVVQLTQKSSYIGMDSKQSHLGCTLLRLYTFKVLPVHFGGFSRCCNVSATFYSISDDSPDGRTILCNLLLKQISDFRHNLLSLYKWHLLTFKHVTLIRSTVKKSHKNLGVL